MTKLSDNHISRQGRVFPERQMSPEEKERRQAEDEEFDKRCEVVFERVKTELIKEHYNWFIVIEPKTGEYFIDKDEATARAKAKEKYPHVPRFILRINETGVCGSI